MTRDVDMASMVSRLRERGELTEARRAGEEALAIDPADDAVVAALVEVYLDIEAQCIATGVTGYMPQIGQRLDTLIPMMASGGADARARHERNRLAMLPGYAAMESLLTLSARDGHEAEAMEAARSLYQSGGMAVAFYPMYATIMYRYGRVVMAGDSSRPVRALLSDYLALAMAGPSRVHSLMLRLAVRAARKYTDFNFTRFFEMWNPRNLRSEDITDPDGHRSTASSALEVVADSDMAAELPRLLDMFPCEPAVRVALLCEAFDALVSRRAADGDTARVIDLLEMYARHPALHSPGRHHSHLLSRALKVMSGGDSWRLPQFMLRWGASFVDADYRPRMAGDGGVIQPLARRAWDRCVSVVAGDVERHSRQLPALLDLCHEVRIAAPPADSVYFTRLHARLMALADRADEAFETMAAMAGSDADRTPDFWADFASLAPDARVRLGILALGALRTRELTGGSTDAGGALSISLAQALHHAGMDNGAAAELRRYRQECDSIAAEPSARYGAVMSTIDPSAGISYDNELLYHRLACDALRAIYARVPSEVMSVMTVGSDGLITLVASDALPAGVDTVTWPALQGVEPGDSVEVKRTPARGVIMAARVDGSEPYSALRVVEGIAVEPSMVQPPAHAPIACSGRLRVGAAIRACVVMDVEGNRSCIRTCEIDLAPLARRYDAVVAVIVDVNADGVATYAVAPGDAGGRFDVSLVADESGPGVGTLVELHYYIDSRRVRHVITARRVGDACADAADMPACAAVRTVSGPLHIDADGTGRVRDVMVPEPLLASRAVAADTYVMCRAICHPVEGWRAVSLTQYM